MSLRPSPLDPGHGRRSSYGAGGDRHSRLFDAGYDPHDTTPFYDDGALVHVPSPEDARRPAGPPHDHHDPSFADDYRDDYANDYDEEDGDDFDDAGGLILGPTSAYSRSDEERRRSSFGSSDSSSARAGPLGDRHPVDGNGGLHLGPTSAYSRVDAQRRHLPLSDDEWGQPYLPERQLQPDDDDRFEPRYRDPDECDSVLRRALAHSRDQLVAPSDRGSSWFDDDGRSDDRRSSYGGEPLMRRQPPAYGTPSVRDTPSSVRRFDDSLGSPPFRAPSSATFSAYEQPVDYFDDAEPLFNRHPSEEALQAGLRPTPLAGPSTRDTLRTRDVAHDDLTRLHQLRADLDAQVQRPPPSDMLVFSDPADASFANRPGRLSASDTSSAQFARTERVLASMLAEASAIPSRGSAEATRLRAYLLDTIEARTRKYREVKLEAWRRHLEGRASARRMQQREADEMARRARRSPLGSPEMSVRSSMSARPPLSRPAAPPVRPPLGRRVSSGPMRPAPSPLISPPRASPIGLGMSSPSAVRMRSATSPMHTASQLGRTDAQLRAGQAMDNKAEIAAQRRNLTTQLHNTQHDLNAQSMTNKANLAARRREVTDRLHRVQGDIAASQRREASQSMADRASMATDRRRMERELSDLGRREAQLREQELAMDQMDAADRDREWAMGEMAEREAADKLRETRIRLQEEVDRAEREAREQEALEMERAREARERAHLQRDIDGLRRQGRELQHAREERHARHFQRMVMDEEAHRTAMERLTTVHALRRYPLPFESTGRVSQLRRDPFRYDPEVDFGYGKLGPLSSYGMEPQSISTRDAQAFDDLYLYESQLRLDRELQESDRQRLWRERLGWEELDQHEQRMQLMEMDAAKRRKLGLGEGGFWSGQLEGAPLDDRLGYTHALDPSTSLQGGGFRRGVPHYGLSSPLQQRFPVWQSGGLGIGSRMAHWLPKSAPLDESLGRTPRASGRRTPRGPSPGRTPYHRGEGLTPAPPPPATGSGHLMPPMPTPIPGAGDKLRRPSTSSQDSDVTTTDSSSPGGPPRPRRRSVTFSKRTQDLEQLRPKSPKGPRSALRDSQHEPSGPREPTMEELSDSEFADGPGKASKAGPSRSSSEPLSGGPTSARPQMGPRSSTTTAVSSPTTSSSSGASSSGASNAGAPRVGRDAILRAAQQARAKAGQGAATGGGASSSSSRRPPPGRVPPRA